MMIWCKFINQEKRSTCSDPLTTAISKFSGPNSCGAEQHKGLMIDDWRLMIEGVVKKSNKLKLFESLPPSILFT